MSCSTLYVVRENGTIESHQRFSNAHRGAFLVWLELAKKYNITDPLNMMFNEAKANEIWALAKRPDVAIEDQITMKTTFDRMLVLAKDFPAVVDAMRKTAKSLPAHCSVLEQADAIEKLIGDTKVTAIGWNHTSVVQVWEDYYDDDKGDYNLSRAQKHSTMFHDEETRP